MVVGCISHFTSFIAHGIERLENLGREAGLLWKRTRLQCACRELLAAHQNRKDDYYYSCLKKTVDRIMAIWIDDGKVDFDALNLKGEIAEDIQRLQTIIKLKNAGEIQQFKQAIEAARTNGFSNKLLEEVQGIIVQYFDLFEKDCAICLIPFSADDFTEKKIHHMACNHFYHNDCIKQWVQNKTKQHCPVCRRVVVDFEQETTDWTEYLRSIDKAVNKYFSKEEKTHLPSGDTRSSMEIMQQDSEYALRLQRELQEEFDRQIVEDDELAVQVDREINSGDRIDLI